MHERKGSQAGVTFYTSMAHACASTVYLSRKLGLCWPVLFDYDFSPLRLPLYFLFIRLASVNKNL